MEEAVPVRLHGDLHFENILFDRASERFTLLDWRQDFGGILEYGDIYYDLAKLKHGLIINHELITQNHFQVVHEGNEVKFEFLRKSMLVECENEFDLFLEREGFDVQKVAILTSLIFLNIAPLHHYPYNWLLFYLGKSGLAKTLKFT
jgi:aminoglycoside phosphotransferase (APT) family kinase protein